MSFEFYCNNSFPLLYRQLIRSEEAEKRVVVLNNSQQQLTKAFVDFSFQSHSEK